MRPRSKQFYNFQEIWIGMQIEDLARMNKEGCEMSVRFEKSGHGFRVCRRQKNCW